MSKTQTSKEAILADVRRAVANHSREPLAAVPAAARFEPRSAASIEEEIERMVGEVRKVKDHSLMIRGPEEFAAAVGKLIRDEKVKTAALSDHPLHRRYGTEALLKKFGIGILSSEGAGRNLADCDLGITVADAALPETGTVLLRTTQGQPDALSLLPRVHLALVAPEAFLPDLDQAFALAKGDRHFELVTGSSRTADIEKVLTLGVHGPKSYHLWICD
jgi:L-lactate dehydrogenase complex protein LldG